MDSMDSFNESILSDAVAFCERYGLSDSKFGKLSPVNDAHIMERLQAGTCRRDTVLRLRRFMARYRLDQESA
jgi:hypothetical protein